MPKTKLDAFKRKGNRQISVDNKNNFIYKLYSILESNSYTCLHWNTAGDAVVIKSSAMVESVVLKNHFDTDKFFSFTRQFHLYGFRRTTDGRKKKNPDGYCEFKHPQFRRGHQKLLSSITRVQPSKTHQNLGSSSLNADSTMAKFKTMQWNTPALSASGASLAQPLIARIKLKPTALTRIPAPTPLQTMPMSAALQAGTAIDSINLSSSRVNLGAVEPLKTVNADRVLADSKNNLFSNRTVSTLPAHPSASTFNSPIAMLAESNAHSILTSRFNEIDAHFQEKSEFEKPASKSSMNAVQTLLDDAGSLSPGVLSFIIKQLDAVREVYGDTFSRLMEKQKSDKAPENLHPTFKKQVPAGLLLQHLPDSNASNGVLHSPLPMHVGTTSDTSSLTHQMTMAISTIEMPTTLSVEATSTMTAQGSAAVNIFTAATVAAAAAASAASVDCTTEILSPTWQTASIIQAPMFSSPQVASFPNQSIRSPLLVAANDNLLHLSVGHNFLKHHHRHSLDNSQMVLKADCFRPMQASQENMRQSAHIHSSASTTGLPAFGEVVMNSDTGMNVSCVANGTALSRHFSVSIPNPQLVTPIAFGNAMESSGAVFPLQQAVAHSDTASSANMAGTPNSIMPLVLPFGSASSPIAGISMSSSNWPDAGDIATIIPGSSNNPAINSNNADQGNSMTNMLSTQFLPPF